MTLKYSGELEIDQERGVIYFHSIMGVTLLRICCLPKPIPTPLTTRSDDICINGRVIDELKFLDITHMYNTSWDPKPKL